MERLGSGDAARAGADQAGSGGVVCVHPEIGSGGYPSGGLSRWRREKRPLRRRERHPPRDRGLGTRPRGARRGRLRARREIARRPDLPADRQRRLRRQPLRGRPRLRAGDEPLRRRHADDDHRPGNAGPLPVQPRLPARPGDRLGDGRRRRPDTRGPRRRPAAPQQQPRRHPAGEADDHPGGRDRERQSVRGRRRLPRPAGTDRRLRHLARRMGAGLLGARPMRRLVHGQRADRRPELVPVQRPPLRQGDVRAPHHRPERLHRDRRRPPGLPDRQRRRHRDDHLGRGAADGAVPGDRHRRPLRRHDRDDDRPHRRRDDPDLQRDRQRRPAAAQGRASGRPRRGSRRS